MYRRYVRYKSWKYIFNQSSFQFIKQTVVYIEYELLFYPEKLKILTEETNNYKKSHINYIYVWDNDQE